MRLQGTGLSTEEALSPYLHEINFHSSGAQLWHTYRFPITVSSFYYHPNLTPHGIKNKKVRTVVWPFIEIRVLYYPYPSSEFTTWSFSSVRIYTAATLKELDKTPTYSAILSQHISCPTGNLLTKLCRSIPPSKLVSATARGLAHFFSSSFHLPAGYYYFNHLEWFNLSDRYLKSNSKKDKSYLLREIVKSLS